ncbi:MAG: KpsF/GutQ family sugar-phosphate isomerase [Pseudomonadota bacterium]
MKKTERTTGRDPGKKKPGGDATFSDDSTSILEQARDVLRIEAEGVLGLVDRLGPEFAAAVGLVFNARGRVVVTGLGKSGLIARKIVATLNSTGAPSIFLHPVEAMHGDLGMVMREDVVLALSNSGRTEEVNLLLENVRSMGARIIAMTGDPASPMALLADVTLDVGVPREACPMGLAPTASTTAALALGDALAVVLLRTRRFSSRDFKRLHPAGALGERLSVSVDQVMTPASRAPVADDGMILSEALKTMNKSNLGVLLVVDSDVILKGIFTDGDLRRAVTMSEVVKTKPVGLFMTPTPVTITRDRLAVEALEIMQAYEITILPIVDKKGRLEGVVHLHHLLGKGKFRFNQVNPSHE